MTKGDFLNRVRAALHRHPGQPAQAPPALLSPLATWNAAELAEEFAAELTLVGGFVHRAADPGEARALLADLVRTLGARTCLRGADELVDEVTFGLDLPVAARPEDADVGITGARFGVAATGTLVLTSDRGRLSSLLPMIHIAVLRAEALVPTMAEALEAHGAPDPDLSGPELPSAWIQATGPSRTADIELTLTTGVHGPGVVHVILIGP